MRQFFYRSGFVIAIEIMVSVLFILCANAMINEKKTYLPIAELDENYMLFFPSLEEKNTVEKIGLKLPDNVRCAGLQVSKRGCGSSWQWCTIRRGKNIYKRRPEDESKCTAASQR